MFARISERFGFRLHGLWMFFGIDTVKGRWGEYSVMDILQSGSSGSVVDVVGEDKVDDDVLTDSEWPPIFREFMTLLQSCLYTRRASVLSCSSMPVQEQKSERNGCASLTTWHEVHSRTLWR